ncbi:MAG: TolC family protein, partial [Dongiaceae bacterium]
EKRAIALQTAAQEAANAYRLSRLRYEAGSIDFLTLLDAQRSQLQAEDAYAVARLDKLSAAILLFKALGGGWEEGA